VSVERAFGQTGALHQLGNPNAIEPPLADLTGGSFEDALPARRLLCL